MALTLPGPGLRAAILLIPQAFTNQQFQQFPTPQEGEQVLLPGPTATTSFGSLEEVAGVLRLTELHQLRAR